jgi:hypothetical protein
LLLGLSLDSPQSRRPNQGILYHSIRCLLHMTMSFGLKSADATYQRGIQRCLHPQRGRNAEA